MSDYPLSAFDVAHPERDEGRKRARQRALTYRITAIALAVLVASAVVETTTSVDVWGVSTRHAVASGGGFELDVRYPSVSRPALATPFDIVVSRPGGFTGPVDLALDPDWIEMWDYQALYPEPSEATAEPGRLVLTFDPPDGEVLRIFFDARIQPSEQSGRRGFVSILEDGEPVVTVSFRTRVRP